MDDRPTRRRVLGSLVGIGLTVGAGGCLGVGLDGEGDSSPGSTSPATSATTTRTATAGPDATSSTTPTTSTTTERTTSEAASTGSKRAETSASASTSTERTEATTRGTSGTGTATTADGTGEESDYTVGMYTDLYFDPIGLSIDPGETVAFELASGVHSAAAYHPDNEAAFKRRVPMGAPAWNTGVFDEEGRSRTVTLETVGTHDYFCLPHKQLGMVGRIVVGDPGGSATESPNPDGDLPDADRIVEEGAISFETFETIDR